MGELVGRRRGVVRLLVVAAITAVAVSLPANVAAYGGSSASTYADAHWAECGSSPYNGTPPSPYVCLSNDCANYASQAMHAGGYGFIAGSTLNPYDQWYWYNTGLNTTSWYQASQLYFFLVYYDHGSGSKGGGTLVADFVGVTASQTYNSLSKGDMIFMDWENNGVIDHVRIEVGYGTPARTGYQSSYNNSYWATGDWADQHTPPRYHDFWNGYYQLSASMAATTHIYESPHPIDQRLRGDRKWIDFANERHPGWSSSLPRHRSGFLRSLPQPCSPVRLNPSTRTSFGRRSSARLSPTTSSPCSPVG